MLSAQLHQVWKSQSADDKLDLPDYGIYSLLCSKEMQEDTGSILFNIKNLYQIPT